MRMARFILIAMVMSMVAVPAPMFAAEKQTGRDSAIIVHTELDYPPYSFLDERGRPAGFNVDLTRAVAEAVNIDVEIKIGSWGEVRKALERGKIDAIAGMYYSKKRSRRVDFSPPYTITYHAIFARKDSPQITSKEELRIREIIVMRGDIMHDYVLEKELSRNPVLVETQAEALRLLASGKHDYALVAKLPGLYWVKKLKLSNVVIVGPPLNPSEYCYAVKRGNAALLALFNKGLALVEETGRYNEICYKWLGVLEPDRIPMCRIVKSAAALLIFLVLAGCALWSRALRSAAEMAREINSSLSLVSDEAKKLAGNKNKDIKDSSNAILKQSERIRKLIEKLLKLFRLQKR